MQKKTNLKNIYIILMQPREAGNIGACCRAIKNMGISRLRLVNPVPYLVPEAFKFCCGAEDLIYSSEIYPDLHSAVADLDYTVGVTRRKGKERHPVYWIDEALPNISAHSQKNKVGFVFGRENKGLFNEELRLCQAQISIPSNRSFCTLNLAQAVLVVCYELFVSKYPPQRTSLRLISYTQLSSLLAHIRSTLALLGYRKQGGHDLPMRIMNGLKRIFGRAGLEERDAQMIHGICSQIQMNLTEPSEHIERIYKDS